jgi:hypothetical protein
MKISVPGDVACLNFERFVDAELNHGIASDVMRKIPLREVFPAGGYCKMRWSDACILYLRLTLACRPGCQLPFGTQCVQKMFVFYVISLQLI